MQRIECVKERFLSLSFALQKLDVVNEQDVDVSVTGLKSRTTVISDGIDEVVREFFRTDVLHADGRVQAFGIVADGVKEMCLTQTRFTVDKQRVVCLCRRLGDCDRGRVREAIRSSDHEAIERVFGIELGIVYRSSWPGRFFWQGGRQKSLDR